MNPSQDLLSLLLNQYLPYRLETSLSVWIDTYPEENKKAPIQKWVSRLERKIEQHKSDPRQYDALPYWSLLIAAGALRLNEYAKAERYGRKARRRFSHCGHAWHRILAGVILILVFQQSGDEERFEGEQEAVLDALRKLERDCAYSGSKNLKKYCRGLMVRVQVMECPDASRKQAEREESKAPEQLQAGEAALVFPIYDPVYAAERGAFHQRRREKLDGEIREIYFNDEPYRLYSLKGEKRVAVISGSRRYGWFPVRENSMNAAIPIPIQEGDYVLVEMKSAANSGDIVFASVPDPETREDHIGVVKRYKGKMLVSESDQFLADIPLQNGEIRGVVRAVAKPN